jgi:hypothetical protein
MSLVRAEIRRLLKRRVTRWMLAIVVLLMATVAGIIAVTHQPQGPAALAQSRADAHAEYERQLQFVERDIAECERAREAGQTGPWPEDCTQMREFVTPEETMVESYLPPTFDFRAQFPTMIMILGGLLALFAFIVGASFVGAEWRSGAMMNLLLWRPRRLEVLAAKLVTLFGFLFGLGLLLGGLWTAAFWLIATFRGVTDAMTPGTWQSFGLTGVRALVLVLVAGAIGFGLASIGRHTAMALGAVITAFVVGVVGLSIVAALVGARYPEAWVWPTYIGAWLERSVVLEDWRACENVMTVCEPPTFEITWQTSGGLFAAVLAVVLGVAVWQMRSRDIT